MASRRPHEVMYDIIMESSREVPHNAIIPCLGKWVMVTNHKIIGSYNSEPF